MATKYFGGLDLSQIGTLTAAAIISLGLITAGSLTVSGTSTFNGDVLLGDSTADHVTYTARVNSNVDPSVTDFYNLGETSLRWQTVNASSVSATTMTVNGINIGTNVTLGQNVVIAPTPTTTNSTPIGTITGPGPGGTKMVKIGNLLYTDSVASSTIKVFDVTNPTLPVLKYTSTSATNFPAPFQIAADAKYVYVTNVSTTGIVVYDAGFATSSQPYEVIQGPFGSSGTLAAVSDGRYLYKLDNAGKIDILDVQNLPSLTQTYTLTLTSSTSYNSSIAGMVKDGNYLFIASNGGEFAIVDVTNPISPVQTSHIAISNLWDIAEQNGRVYLSDFAGDKLYTYNVHDPYAPVLLDTLSPADPIVGLSSLFTAGRYLYATHFNSQYGIGIYDILTSVTPSNVGFIGYANYGYSNFIVDGKYVYAEDEGNNILSIYLLPSLDTTGLLAGSAQIGTLTTEGPAWINGRLAVSGDVSIESNLASRGNAVFGGFYASNSVITSSTVLSSAGFYGPVTSTNTWTFNRHGTIMDIYDFGGSNHGQVYIDSAGFQIGTVNNANIDLYVQNTSRMIISTSEWQPGLNNSIGLGDATHNFINGFFLGTVSSTSFIASGPVTTTGAVWYAPNLNALGATGDFLCQNNTTNFIEVQLLNCTVSSMRFKEHIASLSPSDLMDRVRKLRAVTFDFKKGFGNGTLGTPKDEGFIAEEVALIDPYLVAYEPASKEEAAKVNKDVWLMHEGQVYIPKTVDYSKVSVLLTGAVQNMDDRLTKLEKIVSSKKRK